MSSAPVRLTAVIGAVGLTLGALLLPATVVSGAGRVVVFVAAVVCAVVAGTVGADSAAPPGPPAVLPATGLDLLPVDSTSDTEPVAAVPGTSSAVPTAPTAVVT
jgi:hypothetical protein